MTFQGLLTALVTPFRDGALDEAAFRSLARRQLDGGVDGLVPCGTTGEAPTLPVSEHIQVVRWAVEEAAGRVPVMAGIGSNSTATAIATAREVEAAGAQGVLATAPYYNKPTQEGLYRHFKAIAESTRLEVCLYDVPGRSGIRILPETVARLSQIGNITTIKDATGDMSVISELLRLCGDRMTLLSGDDFTVLPFLALGGAGTISVASNVAPARMKALVDAGRAGDLVAARAIHLALFPMFKALFLETNPIPVKAGMAAMGLLEDELRLPLCPMSEVPREALLAVLREVGVLS